MTAPEPTEVVEPYRFDEVRVRARYVGSGTVTETVVEDDDGERAAHLVAAWRRSPSVEVISVERRHVEVERRTTTWVTEWTPEEPG